MKLLTSPYVFNGKINGGNRLFWSDDNLISIMGSEFLYVFDADILLQRNYKEKIPLNERLHNFPINFPYVINLSIKTIQNNTCDLSYLQSVIYVCCIKDKTLTNVSNLFVTALHSQVFTTMCEQNHGKTPTEKCDLYDTKNTSLMKQRKEQKHDLCNSFKESSETLVKRLLKMTKRFSIFCWGPSLCIREAPYPSPTFFIGTCDGSLLQLRHIDCQMRETVLVADINDYFEKHFEYWKCGKKQHVSKTICSNTYLHELCNTSQMNDFSLIQNISDNLQQTSFFYHVLTKYKTINIIFPATAINKTNKMFHGSLCAIAFRHFVTLWWLQESLDPKLSLNFGCLCVIEIPLLFEEDCIISCVFSDVFEDPQEFYHVALYTGSGFGDITSIHIRLQYVETQPTSMILVIERIVHIKYCSQPVTYLCVSPKEIMSGSIFLWLIVASLNQNIFCWVESFDLQTNTIQQCAPLTYVSTHESPVTGLCCVDLCCMDDKNFVVSIESIGLNATYVLNSVQLQISTEKQCTIVIQEHYTSFWSSEIGSYFYDAYQLLVNASKKKKTLLNSSFHLSKSSHTVKKNESIRLYGLESSPQKGAHCLVQDVSSIYQTETCYNLVGITIETFKYQSILNTVLNSLLVKWLRPLKNVIQKLITKQVPTNATCEVFIFSQLKLFYARQPMYWLMHKLQIREISTLKHLYLEEPFLGSDYEKDTFLFDPTKFFKTSSSFLKPEHLSLYKLLSKTLGMFHFDLKHSKFSESDNDFGSILCFLLYHFISFLKNLDPNTSSQYDTILNYLLYSLTSAFDIIKNILCEASKHFTEENLLTDINEKNAKELNELLKQKILMGFFHIELCRCLLSLWSLMEPAFASTWDSVPNYNLTYQIKKYFLYSCLNLSCFVQKNTQVSHKHTSIQNLLKAICLCVETKAPLCSSCLYCHKISECPYPYTNFYCSSENGISHTLPISYLTLDACRSVIGKAWHCALCGHTFEFPLADSKIPSIIPFLHNVPRGCPICFGNTRQSNIY
ncbi:uncharacterized protein LOC128883812 [Hylaeus volcanicus]|uniref:uncharacterized protein LOC128883812 n=1 Tax=Hylaeus volcanicus TaxID=313075 RepID=UPI0023B7D025|nr:uncharacterized protein LOC128883812 [Hylaeus volcanicus]